MLSRTNALFLSLSRPEVSNIESSSIKSSTDEVLDGWYVMIAGDRLTSPSVLAQLVTFPGASWNPKSPTSFLHCHKVKHNESNCNHVRGERKATNDKYTQSRKRLTFENVSPWSSPHWRLSVNPNFTKFHVASNWYSIRLP